MNRKFCFFVYRSILTGALYRVDFYGDVQAHSIRRGWIKCWLSYEFFRQPHFKLIAKNVMFKCPL